MFKKFKEIAFISAFIFLSPSAFSTHYMGSRIGYEHLSGDSFFITLEMYRDCAGIAPSNSESIFVRNACGTNINLTLALQNTVEVSSLCDSQILNSTCNGGSWPGVDKSIYTGMVVLSSSCSEWTLAYHSCCRNNQVDNLINPGSVYMYIESKVNTSLVNKNNSVSFESDPVIYSCMNNQMVTNVGAFDMDGDSLVYSIVSGFTDSNLLVPYSSNYSALQPLPGGNLTLDSLTGQYSFTPTATGVYVVNVEVNEYDRGTGVWKGKVRKDFEVVVQNCQTASPVMDSVGIQNLTGGSRINSNTLEVCAGDSVSFDVVFRKTGSTDSLFIEDNLAEVFGNDYSLVISGSNPITAHVTIFGNPGNSLKKSFLLKAYDNACPVILHTQRNFDLTVKEGVFAGSDKTICLGDWVDLEAFGGPQNSWIRFTGSIIDTNDSSPNYNMTCVDCLNPSVSPQVTSTYILISNLVGCSNIDTVTVNVSPAFNLIGPNDTLICDSSYLDLAYSTDQSGFSYTQTWSPSLNLSSDTATQPSLLCVENQNYMLQVSAGGCTRKSNFTVTTTDILPMGLSSNDTLLCAGDSINLSVNFDSSYYHLCGTTTSLPITPTQVGVIGTASTNSTGGLYLPYAGNQQFSRFQMILDSAELSNMGLEPGGEIWSLSFHILNKGSATNEINFEISLGCTSKEYFSFWNTWENNLEMVHSSPNISLVNGWNTYAFTKGYIWDGESNIVVNVCSENPNNPIWNQYPSVSYTATLQSWNTKVIDSKNSGVSQCNNPINNYTSINRPNVRLTFNNESLNPLDYNFVWSPNLFLDSVASFSPKVAPTSDVLYTVKLRPKTGGCLDSLQFFVEVDSTFDARFSLDSIHCINGDSQQFVPNYPWGIFTGAGISSSGMFNPASAGVGFSPITYSITTPLACANDTLVMVEVIDLPDATITPKEYCANSGIVFLEAATPGGNWFGNNVTNSATGAFNTTGAHFGNHSIYYQLTTPCLSSDTATIRIIKPYRFSVSNNLFTLCQGSILDLNDHINKSNGPFQGTHGVMTFTDIYGIIDSNGVFNSDGVGVGSYDVTINYSDSLNNCGTTSDVTIQVVELDYATFIDPPSYCSSQNNAKLFIDPWLFGSKVSFSQRPLGSLGANDTLEITPFGQNGQFNPQALGVGSWEITMSRENSFGCIGKTVDTIYVLDPPDTAVTNLGLELTANAGVGYVYQWLDCDDNMRPIAGATSQTFVPGGKGNYAVEIKAGNCIETSGCHATWPVSTNNLEDLGIEVYPNPVGNELFVESGVKGELQIELLDNIGKSIWLKKASNSNERIDMTNFPSGVYIVKISSGDEEITLKVVKE